MNSYRNNAIIAGVLLIIATVVGPFLSFPFLEPMKATNYLVSVSANENQVLIGVLLLLTMTASVVLIPIMMFPILKKHNESLALGYVGARIFEGFFSAVNVIILLSLLSLSREFVNAGAPVASYFQTSGTLLLAAFDWGSILLDFPFCLSVLVFNYLLYESKLVPRWLSVWGIIGGALFLVTASAHLFGLLPPSLEILAIIIAAQEMVFAAWLIVKGFSSSAIASYSTKK